MTPHEFVAMTRREMEADGVTVTLHDTESVKHSDGTNCSGWFDPEDLEMVAATGKSFWLEIYAHEYCHYTQWKDGILKADADPAEDYIWDWLSGVHFTREEVEFSVRACQRIEADNERRTVECIKKYKLPIELEQYIQKCNAYIMFYDVVFKTRQWSDAGKPVYSVPEIYGKLPGDRILTDAELENAPQRFFDAVSERCQSIIEPKPWWQRSWEYLKFRARHPFASVYDPRHDG